MAGRLGVHIADVSHYVTPGSPVDAEAYRRGTSVYFADRVIPMLPETLSNGACSLYAGEDRLTMSALMDFDESGECLRSEIFPSVIRSCVRGVYSEVNDLFMNSAEESVKEKYAGVLPMLLAMRELAARLREKAAARGALRLESVEARFLLDEQGRPGGGLSAGFRRGGGDDRAVYDCGKRCGGAFRPGAGAAFPLPRARAAVRGKAGDACRYSPAGSVLRWGFRRKRHRRPRCRSCSIRRRIRRMPG